MSTTILYGDRTTSPSGAVVDGDHLWLSDADMHAATGWKLETEGLCKGDACIRRDDAWLDADGRIDLNAFAAHMGQPAITDSGHGIHAFGESVNARRDQLFSLQAPEFTLPDIDGNQHSLSDFLGKKVFMYSWGSY